MSVDYIVASLPALRFGEPAPITRERFEEITSTCPVSTSGWEDLETQLRNAVAQARAAEKGVDAGRYLHAATGCSLYWSNRVSAAFQETDPLKRDEALDRVWWDAAEELTDPSDPLGKGALATYAVRLELALKRSSLSAGKGNEVFDRLSALRPVPPPAV